MTLPPAPLVGLTLAVVFTVLAVLHVFWAFRGVGTSVAIPEVDGKPAFVPTRAQTLAVAMALTLAALVVLLRSSWIAVPGLPAWLPRWGCRGLGTILLLRAIGERRLVGFFKTVRGTRFARWDTWLFSPLCALLGAGARWLV
jgi:hypothetical protein